MRLWLRGSYPGAAYLGTLTECGDAVGSCWCPHEQGTCSLPTSDPLVVGLSLHPLGIFVLLSLQPTTAGPGFCAFASFSSLYFPASFTKTPILPSPCPGDLHRKLTLNMAKERPGRPGRGSSHKMWCVALCVPFVIPLHNELRWPPTSPGLPASSLLPLDVAAGRDGDAPRQAVESTAFVLRKGKIWAGWRLPCSCSSKKYLASPPAPRQSAGGPSGRALPSAPL